MIVYKSITTTTKILDAWQHW